MPFTDEEKAEWLRQKRKREPAKFSSTLPPAATCTHCRRPFSMAEGTVFGDFPICDACEGD